MKRSLSIALVAAALIQASGTTISAQGPDGPLTYFNTNFVTGDVVVGGVSLFRKGVNGIATQNIVISGVPADAEILSAYLYIQTTVRESQGERRGHGRRDLQGQLPQHDPSRQPPGESRGRSPRRSTGHAGTQACWSYGWNPRRRLVTYRADVLRFLEINPQHRQAHRQRPA